MDLNGYQLDVFFFGCVVKKMLKTATPLQKCHTSFRCEFARDHMSTFAHENFTFEDMRTTFKNMVLNNFCVNLMGWHVKHMYISMRSHVKFSNGNKFLSIFTFFNVIRLTIYLKLPLIISIQFKLFV